MLPRKEIKKTTKKAATVTWYIINTLALVFCLRGRQYNEDKQYEWITIYLYAYMLTYIIIIITTTYINITTSINYLNIDNKFITYKKLQVYYI